MHTYIQRTCAAILTVIFVFAMSAFVLAQTNPHPNAPANTEKGTSAPSGKLATSDRTFMRKAGQGGLAEVELGNLAQQNASNDQVKQFGERMVTDHTKANDTLKSLAGNKNVALPTQMDAASQREKTRLEKLKGTQFDMAYMNTMVKDHQKDVADFRREARTAKDPDVKAFAQQTLPILEDHLKMAREVQSSLRTAPKTSKKGS